MESVASVAYYSPEQYALLLKLADDRENLHDTWQEWVAEYARARATIEAGGLKTQAFNVDVRQMVEYFKKQGKKNISANRATYVSEITNLFGA